MKRHKLVGFVVLACLLSVMGAFAYVHNTIATYENAAPCGKLTGVPGLLQAAHLVPTGNCEVNTKDGSCQNTRACSISNPPSGGSSAGRCTTTVTPKGQKGCVCQ